MESSGLRGIDEAKARDTGLLGVEPPDACPEKMSYPDVNCPAKIVQVITLSAWIL